MMLEECESIAARQVDMAYIKHEVDSPRVGTPNELLDFGAFLMELVRVVVILQRESFLKAVARQRGLARRPFVSGYWLPLRSELNKQRPTPLHQQRRAESGLR